jgi:uncharacterized phiE125 gp8 family phage protein
MGMTLVTSPVAEPVSLSDARAHLRIDDTTADASLIGYITAARQWCEGYTRRVFARQTWEFTLDEWPCRIDFPLAPVVSVSSITYLDADNTEQTLESDQYVLCGVGPDNIPFIVPAYNVTWPSLYSIPEAVTVQFVCGYLPIPASLKTAILLHTELLFDRNIQNRELIESARNALLDPYRRV